MNSNQIANMMIALGILLIGAFAVVYFQNQIDSQQPTVRSCSFEEKVWNNGRGTKLIVVPPGKFYESSLSVDKSDFSKKRRISMQLIILPGYDYTHSDGAFRTGLRAHPRAGIVKVQIGSETRLYDFAELAPQNNTWVWENISSEGTIKFQSDDRCMVLGVTFIRS